LFHDNVILCHFYFRNEKKLTVINGKELESDYNKRNIKVGLRWVMDLKLRWSQEIKYVMGKARKCYLVTGHQRLIPVRLDSYYNKRNIKVGAGMGHGFEVEMVTEIEHVMDKTRKCYLVTATND